MCFLWQLSQAESDVQFPAAAELAETCSIHGPNPMPCHSCRRLNNMQNIRLNKLFSKHVAIAASYTRLGGVLHQVIAQ
jgi:hypothetical protein